MPSIDTHAVVTIEHAQEGDQREVDPQVAFTVCKCAVLRIAASPNGNGDSMLNDMRVLFDIMHRVATDDDYATEIIVTGEDCLWRSARAGNTAILSYLLRERQVSPDARRAMHYAVRYGQTAAVELLVAHGARTR
jgi:hypothetical protein